MRRFGQQVSDAAVAGDGDVELLVAGLAAALVEFEAAGLDVVEVGHDHPGFGQGVLDVVDLPHHRLTRVLEVLGGGAAQHRDPDFSAEQLAQQR
ncbi:hypothetical protein [Actinophytocola oryzae]|uniref:hypothetical protein n=1 Tax=Actinophytocola oryzae TaxID=502181 RepID=UPI001FBB366B|nr:hypothetical protein [Actinophytocola oryzae]